MALTGKVPGARPALGVAHYANALATRTTVAASFLHGGRSTGPRTEEGIARLAASKTTHGRTTKAERAKAKHRAEVGRQVMRELKEIEQWCVDQGHLTKDWRDRC